ncbi:nitroreductase family protein [Sphaerisporangium sp. TRM90804]|uniref:nitroreductase family protein n=1 Tax=Sphaerisporangium sp. TRM90804 TaxID=3031113 RepID=UPI002446D0EE|nr:nitroreductase family protein [Sphaerisporangium sp. TRM90804]MDH2430335.1 nitroreductase family protein [Sphaerisporangium sp. TRM90804]
MTGLAGADQVTGLDELLVTTRAVRRRLDLTRPVDVELVRECLRVALQAPNGANGQRWRWLVVTEPGLRRDIGQVYRRAFENRYPPAVQANGATARQLAGARYLAENLARVPVLVIPCLELSGPRLPDGNQAGVWGSLLPAVWSYMLAARARGLGTVWTTVHLDAEADVARLLGLPATVHQGALIPTAHTLGDTFAPAPRHELDTVLHLNGWHDKPPAEKRNPAMPTMSAHPPAAAPGPGTTAVGDWLARFVDGWRAGDPRAIGALFTPDATYYRGPFEPRRRGTREIVDHWTEVVSKWPAPEVRLGAPLVQGERASVEFWCVVRDPATGTPRTTAGSLVLRFAPDGRCARWHEYFSLRPDGAALEPAPDWLG